MAATVEEPSLYAISYDIPEDRRRTKIHNVLSGVGVRVQYSVFECHLTKKELLTLEGKLSALTRRGDSLRTYALCSACATRAPVVGGQPPTERKTIVI